LYSITSDDEKSANLHWPWSCVEIKHWFDRALIILEHEPSTCLLDNFLVILCLILQEVGEDWVTDLSQLRRLLPKADSQAFMTKIFRVKQVGQG